MAEHLLFYAGAKAFSAIRERGLSPEMVRVIAGAAGGPKWIVLYGLDRAIFFSWLRRRRDPLFMLGSSIGAWRFTALAHPRAERAYERFREGYIGQRYEKRPTPEEVSSESLRILEKFLGASGDRGVFRHPWMRLNIMAVRCRGALAQERPAILGLGLASTALTNAVSRKGLRLFFERTLLHDPRDRAPFFGMDGFPIHRVPLSAGNLRPALLASGSIPLVMAGVRNIPGAPEGMYRDGGLVDYHLDIPYSSDREGIVLYPHYAGKIIPGWFDKHIPWRKPGASNMDNVLMVCPSPAFLETLPLRKIPDRDDFKLFFKKDEERIAYWERVRAESVRLGDEFLHAVRSGRIRDKIRPLNTA